MERTETSTKQASEPGRITLGSVLVLGHAVKHVFNSGLFIILPELQLQIHLGLSNAAIGTLSAIRNTGSGLATLPAGYMADRFSSRWRAILAVVHNACGRVPHAHGFGKRLLAAGGQRHHSGSSHLILASRGYCGAFAKGSPEEGALQSLCTVWEAA